MASANSERIKILTELMSEFRSIKTIDRLPRLLERATHAVDSIFGRDSEPAKKFQTIIKSVDFTQLEDYVSLTSTGKLTHLHITGWDRYRDRIQGNLQIMIDDLRLTHPPAGKSTPRIFVSYRRVDSAGHTGRLYDRLKQEFGANLVFFDIDSIQPGEDFIDAIEQAVSSCQVLLAVIGSQWLTITDEHGERRLDNPTDYVRLEIATALTRNIRVIPVLVSGARIPQQSVLPPDLSGLARRNAFEVTDKNFHADVDKLLTSIKQLVVAPSAKQTSAKPSAIPMPTVTQKVGDKQLDDFLFQSFETIKVYFQQALAQLNKSNDVVETSFREVTNHKFMAEIFVQGKSKARCKIWLGSGLMGRRMTIGYSAGKFDLSNDNSYNELISAEAHGSTLFLRLSLGNVFPLRSYEVPEEPNAGQTAEILWRRFTNDLKL